MNFKWLNFLVAAALATLYAATTPTQMPDADGPEFIVIGRTGGIAHPPGYPLYCLLLRFVNLFIIDNDSSVRTFACLSAIMSGIAAWLLLDMLARIGISGLARFAAVGIAFTSFAVWHVSNNTEPFALNLMLSSGVMWCVASLIYAEDKFGFSNRLSTMTLGLLFGFGVCNHHTQAMLVPMTFIALISEPSLRRHLWQTSSLFLSGVVVGLLPLTYFFTTDHLAPMVWGLDEWRLNPISRLITHLLRKEYGTFQLVATKDATWNAPFLFKSLSEMFFHIGLLIIGYGAWVYLKPKSTSSRNDKLFISCLLINVPIICAFFFMAKGQTDLLMETILFRFVALPVLLLTPLLAFGLDPIISRISKLTARSIVASVVIFSIISNLEKADRRLQILSEFTARTILETTKDGYIISYSDLIWAGVPFLQVIRGLGQNARVIGKWRLENKQYRDNFFRKWRLPYEKWGGPIDFFNYAIDNGGLAFEALPIGSPIIERFYPLGPLYVAAKTRVPDPVTVFRVNELIYTELLKSPAMSKDSAMTGWEKRTLTLFARPWRELPQMLEKTHPELAEKARTYRAMFEIEDQPTGNL